MTESTEQNIQRKIDGKGKTVWEILNGAKFKIDYYQREYRWTEKHIQELLDDLTNHFSEDYDPNHSRQAIANYGHYFLGSIIISEKSTGNFIVDGQQRLTSLTLLLIYLRHCLKGQDEERDFDALIRAQKFGVKSFNIMITDPPSEVQERTECMEALLTTGSYNSANKSDSVRNIVTRYEDIERAFPEKELTDKDIPYFKDWLLHNVHLVEITTYTDDDAYTIFETMNDRGLSLGATDMLKGYMLANIEDEKKRNFANDMWKKRVHELHELRDMQDQGKEPDADAFKAWLRSQYAQEIRERKKGAKPKDWDRIGTEFHRWVREQHQTLGLNGSESYYQFILRDFEFYSGQYLRLIKASNKFTPGLEHVFYNAQYAYTLQYQLLLAPLNPSDTPETVDLKLKLVAMYVDILINRRIWNRDSIAYSNMQYAMFLVMRDIRGKEPRQLAEILQGKLEDGSKSFKDNPRFALHNMNRKYVQRILARLTDFIETESGLNSHFVEYTTGKGKKKYEIEHIWADHPERHKDEFSHPTDFADYRNRIGDLLLLLKPPNASLNDAPYSHKLPYYDSQNLLARSLHPNAYKHNPGFKRFVESSGLPFHAHSEFKKADLDDRQELYLQIAEQLWKPARLTELVE
ncbi:MAG: DUF262 domain-containing protein [Chloroflexi bacterium]|nr:DUF262 domain-containing protein [Chloroflexota bacterium]